MTNTRKWTLVAVAAIVTGLWAMFALWLGGAIFDQSVPACEFEDGSTQQTCYWDGHSRGNGIGRSYVSYDYGSYVKYTD